MLRNLRHDVSKMKIKIEKAERLIFDLNESLGIMEEVVVHVICVNPETGHTFAAPRKFPVGLDGKPIIPPGIQTAS